MRISDWSSDVCSSDLAERRDAVVRRREGLVRPARLQAPLLQEGEGVERAVVCEMARDEEQRLAVLVLQDLVLVPDLVEHGSGFGHGTPPSLGSRPRAATMPARFPSNPRRSEEQTSELQSPIRSSY